jgi:EpsD family peptidyl-prolyl cis-trans isomerase
MHRQSRIPAARVVMLAALAVLLAACGRDESARQVSQVAAKVNKEEITVHQLNGALAQFRGLGPEQQKAATKQVLERLIEQELLVQKAVAKKLDRDPRVVQAIEASKRQILAQSYLETLTAQAGRPSAEEIAKFYAERPELFAERKVYRLQEIAIPVKPDLTLQALEEQVRKAKSLNDVVAWLKSIDAPYSANAAVKPAEQLPLEIVPRLAQLQPGQAMLMPAQAGFLLVQVVGTEKQPLDDKQARAFIEQYLAGQKRLDLARAEVKTLRDGAKIEYVGEFGAEAPVKAERPAPAPAAGEKSAIDKGVAGLR